MLRADAVCQRIDQAGHVRRCRITQARCRRPVVEPLDDQRGKRYPLDAEAGVDGRDPLAEQPGQPPDVTHRLGRADAHGLDAVVDPMAEEIEASRAEAAVLQRKAEVGDEQADVSGDGLGGANRLGKVAPCFDPLRDGDRRDRLAGAAERLIEPPADLWPEAQRQRCARLRRHFADRLEAQASQRLDSIRRQAQCRDRQIGDRGPRRVAGDDQRRRWAMTGEGMRSAERSGHCSARLNAGVCQTPGEVGEHRLLAAVQMRSTAGIDDQTIGGIGGNHRRIAPQRPHGEAVERGIIGSGLGVMCPQAGNERLRLRGGHARPQAETLRGGVGRTDNATAAFLPDQHQRHLRRRRGSPHRAPQPVGRPGRQEQRDDPLHRRLRR